MLDPPTSREIVALPAARRVTPGISTPIALALRLPVGRVSIVSNEKSVHRCFVPGSRHTWLAVAEYREAFCHRVLQFVAGVAGARSRAIPLQFVASSSSGLADSPPSVSCERCSETFCHDPIRTQLRAFVEPVLPTFSSTIRLVRSCSTAHPASYSGIGNP
jgi:hypothetical protein